MSARFSIIHQKIGVHYTNPVLIDDILELPHQRFRNLKQNKIFDI